MNSPGIMMMRLRPETDPLAALAAEVEATVAALQRPASLIAAESYAAELRLARDELQAAQQDAATRHLAGGPDADTAARGVANLVARVAAADRKYQTARAAARDERARWAERVKAKLAPLHRRLADAKADAIRRLDAVDAVALELENAAADRGAELRSIVAADLVAARRAVGLATGGRR